MALPGYFASRPGIELHLGAGPKGAVDWPRSPLAGRPRIAPARCRELRVVRSGRTKEGGALLAAGREVRAAWTIGIASVALMLIGLAALYRAETLEVAATGYAARQAGWVGLALVAMAAMSLPSYRLLSGWAYALYAVALLLLIAVYFFPAIHGAHRWIRFGPLGLQPSEFAKLCFVLALGRYLMYRTSHRRLVGLLAPMAITVAPSLLILREPDLGTAIVFWPTLFCMLWAAGARRAHLLAIVVCGISLTPVLWHQMSNEQRSRVTALIHQSKPGDRPVDGRYHLHQAKQMLALGGPWGSLASADAVDNPAMHHLPEAHTDFIFCVVAELAGLPGIALVLGLLLLLVWQSLTIALATREPFARLVAAGIASLFGIQLIINTGMTVGLMPITGLSLPLLSYGGSGLLAHAMAIGIVTNFARRPGFEIAAEPFRFSTREQGQRRRAVFALGDRR